MRPSKLLGLSAVVLTLFLATCEDQPTLTEPVDAVDASFGKAGGGDSPESQRIQSLLIALYPGPGLENAALNRWANIQRQLSRGQATAAQSQMRALAKQVTGFAADGRLDVPADPLLPVTVQGAVSELVTRLFVFVGLEVAEALQEYPDALPEDFGIGTVDADGGTVVTTNAWAAVIAEAGATEGTVFVTIELLDEETCALADPLTQALGCWDINRYPAGDFSEDVKVEICVADNPSITDDEWDLLLVHRRSDDGEVNALPWAEPINIDCTGFDPTAPQQTAGAGVAGSMFSAVGHRLAGLFMPEPLGASMRLMANRPPRGIGGTTGSFSDFFGAVPDENSGEEVAFGAVGAPGNATYRDFFFNAVKNADGSVAGRYKTDYTNVPNHGGGVFTCMNVVGNRAWLGGWITHSALFPEIIGLPFGVRVVDEGTVVATDRYSFIFPLPFGDDLPFAGPEDYCAAMPEFPLDENLITADKGNLTVAGGETQPTPEGYDVSGVVRYSDTPLPGVRVTLFPTSDPGSAVETATDATGHYRFIGIASGDYTIRVHGDGYPDPEASDQYPFISWTGRTVQVVDADVVQDRDLPKVIRLLTPNNGATVDPDGLTLTWEPNAETEAGGYYSIQINDSDQWFPTTEVGQSTGPSYQVQDALSPGETYTWQVHSRDVAGRSVGSTTYAFEYAIPETTEGSWAWAGSLLGPRRDDAALLLDDGTVFVNGGTGSGVELFDPETGTSTLLHPNGTGQGSTATLLEDGRVLRVGPDGTDIFDPVNLTISYPTLLPDSLREYHSAVRLADGKVLIAGGRGWDPITGERWDRADAEIFDPATNTFTPTAGALGVPRHSIATVVLPDGKVLLAGGTYLTSPGYAAETDVVDVFDPATGLFTATGSLNTPRGSPIATPLLTGRVLVTGTTQTPELYDPASGTFSYTGSMREFRWAAHTATRLLDGRVLVTGGVEVGEYPVTLTSAEIYDPVSGTFTRAAWMNQARQQHRAVLLPGGRVLVLGGFDFATDGGSDLSSVEIFTPGGGGG